MSQAVPKEPGGHHKNEVVTTTQLWLPQHNQPLTMSSLETPVDLTKDEDVVFIQTDSFKFFWEAKPATLERARKSWKSNRLYIPAATRKAKTALLVCK